MHTLSVILSWALVGLIIGLIAHLLVAGQRPRGFLRTILVGIAGAILGGLIYSAIHRYPGRPFSFSENSSAGWLYAIGGAVVLLMLFIEDCAANVAHSLRECGSARGAS